MTSQIARKSLAALAATLLVGSAAAVPTFAATPSSYTVVDLGTLGGANSIAYGLNGKNQVVGYSQVPGNEVNAAVYNGGSMTNLGCTPDTSVSYAYGINNSGTVVGQSGSDAAVFQNGRAVSLGTLGGPSSIAKAINVHGDVVGQSYNSGYLMRAFLAKSGQQMVDLGTLGGGYSYATDLNNKDEVAGYSYGAGNTTIHAFLYNGGQMFDIGTLGGSYSYGTALNAVGEVVGFSYVSGNSAVHAFVWTAGRPIRDLGTLGGSGYSYAYGVNCNNRIVGQSNGHGVLWLGNTIYDLNNLVPSNSGWTVVSAYAINASNCIAANGYANGVEHALLLKPD